MSLSVWGCTNPVTIDLVATDYAFTTPAASVAAGQTVRFKVTNKGTVAHEWVLDAAGGSAANHAGGHVSALATIPDSQLKPGAASSRDVTFSKPGEYEFACHLPGHYEQGMKATIVVK